MAYNIGQVRRNQMTNYATDVGYRVDLLVNNNSIIDFYDPCMFINDGEQLSSLNSYYLKFSVKQMTDSVQDFTIKLQNSELMQDNVQSIKSFSAKGGTEESIFELIFNPNQNYNQIIFELRRAAFDFNYFNEGKSGRIMEIEVLEFYVVNNIITGYLQSHYEGLQQLKKIGIQGPPGLMFVLDGEEMRLGKTGIYELYDDRIQVSYLGFIVKDSTQVPDGKDFFILDFKY